MNVLGLSAEHEANLRKLAAEGLKIPDNYEKFNMRNWRITNDQCVDFTGEPMPDGCGTSACMIGHAPFLGFRKPKFREPASDYIEDVFGLVDFRVVMFLFGGQWCEEDFPHNTARACASRILWALEHGMPQFGWKDYEILDEVTEPDWMEQLVSKSVVKEPVV